MPQRPSGLGLLAFQQKLFVNSFRQNPYLFPLWQRTFYILSLSGQGESKPSPRETKGIDPLFVNILT